MHTKKHVKRFPGKKHNKSIASTMRYMFSDSKEVPDESMLAVVEEVMLNTNFQSMEYNWYSYVPALWRLQRFNETNNLRNFTIIPQNSPGRLAIRIDTYTMKCLVNSITKDKIVVRDGMKFTEIWCRYINYFKYETGKRRFDFDMITDGVSFAVLQMARPKKPKLTEFELEKLKEERMERMRDKLIGNSSAVLCYNVA